MVSKKCEVCGIEIVPSEWIVKGKLRVHYNRFCSEKCRARYYYITRLDYYKKYQQSLPKRGLVKSACKMCGSKFMSKASNHYTCSEKCSKKLLRQNQIAWKKNNPERVNELQKAWFKKKVTERLSVMPSKLCPLCGKEFHPLQDRMHAYKTYCSKKCQIKSSGKRQTRERMELLKHPDFTSKKYVMALARKRVQDANYHAFRRGCPKDDENHISLKSWLEIKEKFGNKCADCGTIESEEMKLTIDHVYPISKGGKNNKDNIEPRCMRCNILKSDKIISISHTSQI